MASASASLSDRSAQTTRGQVLLLVSALAFSTAGFFTREAPVDVWAMVFWRNLFGSAALLPFILASKGQASWRVLLTLGRWGWATIAAAAFGTICFLAALSRTSVADVSIIYATAPLMTALLARVWLRERASRRTLAAAVLALVGVAVTFAGARGGGALYGDALALLMTISLSLMTVFIRRQARFPALPVAWLASLVAALAVLPCGWAAGASFAISWPEAAWLAAFGVTAMAVAQPCLLAGAALVPGGQAMLISAMELPLAPLWVWLAFAETPSNAAIFGGAIVAAAILWQLREKA